MISLLDVIAWPMFLIGGSLIFIIVGGILLCITTAVLLAVMLGNSKNKEAEKTTEVTDKEES